MFSSPFIIAIVDLSSGSHDIYYKQTRFNQARKFGSSTNKAENLQTFKNTHPQLEIHCSYEKKCNTPNTITLQILVLFFQRRNEEQLTS